MAVVRDAVRDYWNDRAWKGLYAGSNDPVLKELEMRELSRHIRDGMTLLDAGCGNGLTALYLAERHEVDITGVDFAPAMIDAARVHLTVHSVAGTLSGTARFEVADIRELLDLPQYDVVYTERAIINLPTWEEQRDAIRGLLKRLKPRGRLLLCEASQDGLDRINAMRALLDLPAIEPPPYNRYLRFKELCEGMGGFMSGLVDFTSTYYFTSRVLNAALARDEGRTPDYHDRLNDYAMNLPSIGDCGQVKLWIWSAL